MAIFRTQREELQLARGTLPAEPMSTVMDTLFPVELTLSQRAPPINTATELFAEHWTGAAGKEISVLAHDSLELVTRVCQEWQAGIFWADALATQTAELQAHVAVLEERLANHTKEQPAGGPTGGPTTNLGPAPAGVVAATPDPTLNASHQLCVYLLFLPTPLPTPWLILYGPLE